MVGLRSALSVPDGLVVAPAGEPMEPVRFVYTNGFSSSEVYAMSMTRSEWRAFLSRVEQRATEVDGFALRVERVDGRR